MKTLNILLLITFFSGVLISCTQQGKDFATEACMRENLNCASPTTTIDLVGGDDEDRESVSADGSGGDVGAVTVKSIRYGENAVIEFLIKNPRFNPLKDFELTMDPNHAAFTVIDGISFESCADNVLTYNETCSVAIKYAPGKVPPDIIELTFKFKTLTGSDFIFKSSFDPAVLIPDFYIDENELDLATTMVYSGAAGAVNTGDIVVENTASTAGQDLTIASIDFKPGSSCSLVAPGSAQCIVGSVLTAQSLATCNIKVAFKPTETGAHSCILEILATNGTYRTYTFTGTSVGLTSTTKTLDYGIVKTSSAAVPKSLTVAVGTDSIPVDASSCTVALDPVDAAFAITSNANPGTVTAGSDLTVDITYTPAATVKSHSIDLVVSCDSRGGELRIPVTAASTDSLITSNTSNLDFGDVLIGDSATKTITLTNSSTTDTMTDVLNNLSTSMGEGYSITGGTCTETLAPSASCTVQVTFTPTESGVSQNNLTNTSSDGSLVPSIGVTGQGKGLTSSQESVDFGFVKTKNDRPGAPIIVTNEASGTATGCSILSSSLQGTGFSIDEDSTCLDATSLAANASCTIVPRFTANSTVGSRSANLQMTCTKGGTLTIPLSAEVTSSLQLVLVPPTEVNWSDRLVGISENVEFTFMNQDSTNLAGFGLSKSGVNSPWSETSNACGATLNAGTSCKYVLTYAPSAAPGAEQTGTTSGTITGSGTGVSNAAASFAATAKKITSSQSSLSFGEVANSTEVLASTRVYFTNPSTVDTASTCALSIPVNFQVADTTCGSELEPEGDCSVLVKLPNTHAASANLSESLDYTCSVGGKASVTMTAQIRKAAILAWSGTAAFGNVDIGPTKTEIFTLTHTGVGLDLAATNVLIDLSPVVGAYSVISNNCPTSLSAGASCTVSVRFNPLVEGAAGATLTATSNIAPVIVNLTGTGVDPAKRIASDTTSVGIATALVGSTHNQIIVLENEASTGSSGNLDVEAVSSPWSTAGCDGTNLAITDTCNLTVTYSPVTVGTSTANLKVNATNTSKTFPLSGTATKIAGPSEYNFGDVPRNGIRDSSAIAISNPSTLDDASGCLLSAEAPFTVQSETCTAALNKNDTCDVVVRLTAPAGDITYTDKKLTVACAVGGTAEVLLKANVKDMPLANMSGDPQFADWDLDNGNLTRLFTITNSNGSTINIGTPAITGSSAFTITGSTCAATLADGASCTVSVAFDPSSSGSQAGTLTVPVDGSGKTGNLATNLSGTGTIMDLDVTPVTLNFAVIKVGDADTETKTVTITNNGNRTANLSYSALAAPWTTGGTCGATLVAGASCEYEITSHAHGSAAIHDTTFVITETQQSDTDTTNVAITGATWDAPLLAVKDDRAQTTYTSNDIALTDITGAIDIPAENIVDLSPSSRSVTFTIKNNRAPAFPLSNLSLNLVKIAGAGTAIAITTDNCTGEELEYNETCTVVVTYTPQAVRETPSNYRLTITGEDDGTPVDLEVTEIRGRSYKGVDLTEDFVATTHSFGLIAASATDETGVITIANDGDLTATNFALAFSGSPTSYSATNNTCGVTLAGGATCSFKVKFTPANVAVAHGHTMSVTSNQDSLTNFATFKGASYIDYQGALGSSATDVFEPEIASDSSYYYISSKADGGTFTRLHLQICDKTSATGNINSASCGNNILTVAGEPYWAGALAGYKLNTQVTTNKILIASSNQKADKTAANKGISTLLVCDKSGINGSKIIDFATSCARHNIHTLAGIGSIENLGEFTAMHVQSNKIVFSSQTPDGYIITACSFDDSALPASALSSCKTHQNSGLGSNQAEYTDVAFNGTNLVMAGHRLNTGLYAVSCTLAGDNTLACGSYSLIDDGTIVNGADTMHAGAHPYIVMDSSGVLIASQQDSDMAQGLRLAKCDIASNVFDCEDNKTVASATGTNGFGLNPSIKVVQRGSSRIAWIQSVSFSNYADPANSNKSITLSYCDLTNWATPCTAYYQQPTFGDSAIYAREMQIDTTKNIITIPFTSNIYRTGVFSIGLLPEL
ncbi:choice-of-anchor D domain-containing protein [Bdellovibrio reynosensis]|uniref:Choice-of-anchor D domain-containing protein n=1 Tax=Bdellovibrio reynosensis TaxID=2835041 RepID=A0ABY4CBR2_9BACT|nr:choice-of-anchor D domain-containing protein [Bdellovibrio reynosensis]UOF02224.1 choice-of-anchor D domain-containing protein [Bdellovibrio reynosensis]